VQINATRKELIIRITDHGSGVPDAERERIFEPFHRIPGARGSGGAGLGLAIARGFAEANGGRLWVESRAGQGATFALAFPVVELPVGVEA
jgi:two-component system sensor histidine kinase KdpD